MVHIEPAPLRIRTERVLQTAKRPARIKVTVNDNGVRSEHTILPPRAMVTGLHTYAARTVAKTLLSDAPVLTETGVKNGGFTFEAVARG